MSALSDLGNVGFVLVDDEPESALEAWAEAGRLLEHLPGLHDQSTHGRRFKVPGDPRSGLRKAAKAMSGGEPEHHRAHAAHSVADAVDDLLAGLDIPEYHKATIARRARAAADLHGAHPSPRAPRTAAPHSIVADAVAHAGRLADTTGRPSRVAAAKADIHSAVDRLAPGLGDSDWVGLADLRDALPGHSRADVDAALMELLDEPGVRIIPVANTKALKPRDREAALKIFGEDNHAISIRGDSRRPRPPAASGPSAGRTALQSHVAAPASGTTTTFAPGASARMPNVLTPKDAIARMQGMNAREDGERLLAKASRADLVAILGSGGWAYPKSGNKSVLREHLVELLIGRRIASDAMSRVVLGREG